MSDGARRGANKTITFVESALTAVGDSVTISNLDITRPHCFAGVQFFDDAEGLISATASDGTVLIEVQTVNTTPVFESVVDNLISAAQPTTITWSANTQAVRAIPSLITNAAFYKLVVTCNEK